MSRGPISDLEKRLHLEQECNRQRAEIADLQGGLERAEEVLAERDRTIAQLREEGARVQGRLGEAERLLNDAFLPTFLEWNSARHRFLASGSSTGEAAAGKPCPMRCYPDGPDCSRPNNHVGPCAPSRKELEDYIARRIKAGQPEPGPPAPEPAPAPCPPSTKCMTCGAAFSEHFWWPAEQKYVRDQSQCALFLAAPASAQGAGEQAIGPGEVAALWHAIDSLRTWTGQDDTATVHLAGAVEALAERVSSLEAYRASITPPPGDVDGTPPQPVPVERRAVVTNFAGVCIMCNRLPEDCECSGQPRSAAVHGGNDGT